MIVKHIENFDLKQIAESGQCFRMNMSDDRTARLTAYGKVLDINDRGGGDFCFSCPEKEFEEIWSSYFDLETDYGRFISSIDPNDRFLLRAAEVGNGIRILRQDPFETLISFIISQRKNIPAIKASVEKLCKACGEKITSDIYAFPSAKAIYSLSEKELSECSLGYRVSYVREAAERVALGQTDLSELNGLSDGELFGELTSFKGVGKKVANCVMLFAYHRIAAFPRDVWIGRIEEEYYKGRFPESRYEGYAGVLQQYMFYAIRNNP